MAPHPSALVFELCPNGKATCPCPNFRGWGGHWYAGELAPSECLKNALPIDNGMSVVWAPDLRHVWVALLEGLAEQAEEGGKATAGPPMEEEDEEEDRRGGSSVAGMVAPLQAPKPV